VADSDRSTLDDGGVFAPPAAPDAAPAPDVAAPPVAPPPAAETRPPVRAGELTSGWRVVVTALWIGVLVAFAAVWNTSVQLGLSTWWLGPRGEPRPMVVHLVPFIAPAAMSLAAITNQRWLGRWGLVAAAATAAIGLGDLTRVPGLALIELVIAACAAVVSLGAMTGTYRDTNG